MSSRGKEKITCRKPLTKEEIERQSMHLEGHFQDDILSANPPKPLEMVETNPVEITVDMVVPVQHKRTTLGRLVKWAKS